MKPAVFLPILFGTSLAAMGTSLSHLLHIAILLFLFTAFLLPRLVPILRRRLGRRIVSRNPAAAMMDGVAGRHFLDLDPEFARAHHLLSLSHYLGSLIYDKEDKELGYLLISAMSSSLGLGKDVVPFLFPPKYVPQSESVTKKTGLLAKFTLERFPSILVLAALVDGAAALLSNGKDTMPAQMDAPDVFALGENPPSSSEQTTGILDQAMLRGDDGILDLTPSNTLRGLIEKFGVDLGLEPDLPHFVCPKPFAPLLLPGLCRGQGGLRKDSTPRQEFHSRVLAAILNKLAANAMHDCGYGTLAKGELYPEFSLRVCGGAEIYTCGEFIHELVARGGGKMECRIRSNITSFGYDLCLLEEEAGMDFDNTILDQRERYTPIPLAFRTRTGVVTSIHDSDEAQGSKDIHQLSSHSAVEWIFYDNALLDNGDKPLRVSFYTGVEGFTGFKPGWEWERSWVLESHNISPVCDGERAADIAAAIAVSSNICVREGKFPFGGYGGLGICADSVAWVEHCLTGRTMLFPLVMRSDAKTWLLRVMHENILGKLEGKLNVNARIPGFVDLVRLSARALVLLPNDIQIEPHEIQDSLDRISRSLFAKSPFLGDQYELARLPRVKQDWKEIMSGLGLWKEAGEDAPQQRD